MTTTKTRLLAATVITAALVPLAVEEASAFAIYTNRTAWEAAAAGTDITNDPIDVPYSGNQDVLVFESGIVSAGSPASGGASNNIGDHFGVSVRNPGPAGSAFIYEEVVWTFPTSVYAFAMDLMPYDGLGMDLVGNFDGVAGDEAIYSADYVSTYRVYDFFGVVADGNFDTLTFAWHAGHPNEAYASFFIDNLAFASATEVEVQEPASLAVMGAGLMSLGLVLRRRNRPVQA